MFLLPFLKDEVLSEVFTTHVIIQGDGLGFIPNPKGLY